MLSTNIDVERQNVRCGQQDGLSAAKEARGRAAMSFNKKRQSGRWGVVPASEHQEILLALASLIRAQRFNMALMIINTELKNDLQSIGSDPYDGTTPSNRGSFI